MPLLKEDTRAAQEAIDKLLDPELLFGTPSPHGAFSSSARSLRREYDSSARATSSGSSSDSASGEMS